MKGFQLKIEGNWGHFKKPETNNNPLSHDLITKTALIGMIGAVLGIERRKMKPLFPQLSEDLLYGVQLLSPVKKVSWGFTSKTAVNPVAPGSPKYFEFLQNPSFKVSLALNDNRSGKIYNKFLSSVENQESIYQPILGWHNCPADLSFISKGEFSENSVSEFKTFGFIEPPPKHQPNINGLKVRIGFEKLPTYQDDDFWNLPEKYRDVIYPDAPNALVAEGEHFTYSVDNGKWWLV
jgi:CRISPR-associated Cas5-like protein